MGLTAHVRVLGIDTATAIACVGVTTPDGAVDRQQPIAGSHARTLLPLIDETLAAAEIDLAAVDLLAVSIGPGSFTGLRIGLAVVKGLALAVGKPAVGVPTLRAYAMTLGERGGTVWPVLDARKGEVYAGGYAWREGTLEEIVAPAAMVPDALDRQLRAPATLMGDGVDAYGARWSAMPGVTQIRLADRPPSGGEVGRLGARLFEAGVAADLADLEPAYCRLAEAELHRKSAVSIG